MRSRFRTYQTSKISLLKLKVIQVSDIYLLLGQEEINTRQWLIHVLALLYIIGESRPEILWLYAAVSG